NSLVSKNKLFSVSKKIFKEISIIFLSQLNHVEQNLKQISIDSKNRKKWIENQKFKKEMDILISEIQTKMSIFFDNLHNNYCEKLINEVNISIEKLKNRYHSILNKKKINTQKMKDKIVETKPQCEMPRRSLCKSNSESLKSDYVNVFILEKQSSQESDTNIKN